MLYQVTGSQESLTAVHHNGESRNTWLVMNKTKFNFKTSNVTVLSCTFIVGDTWVHGRSKKRAQKK